jgi:cullin-associated NEDD8-dissociated protein 1
VGHRFGRHLATAVPLAISYCDEAGENEEELQEYCLQVPLSRGSTADLSGNPVMPTQAAGVNLSTLLLQALESFVLRSPHEVRPYLDTILATTLKYLSYDPNYADDMDADEDGDEDEDEADDEWVPGKP